MMAEDLTLRQRFRRDLEALGKRHPTLKDPYHQDRITRYLEEDIEQEDQDHEPNDQAEGEGQTQ
jgi:hypothetical protein